MFRKQMLFAELEEAARALSSVELGRDLRLADLTSRRALGFGVTASLSAGAHYDDSQAFAADAVRAGFDGVRYPVRHDSAQLLVAIALFGSPGAPDPADRSWPRGDDGPIPHELVEEASRRFGYRVLPEP